MRRQLPSTVRYFQPFKDAVTTTIAATTSVFELTELIKKALPGDQFTITDPVTQQQRAASFAQWVISRIDLGDLEKAKRQVTNEIIGRVYAIIDDTVPKSKIITPWDIQMAILRAGYLGHFFDTVGNAVVKDLLAEARKRPGFLPVELVTSVASQTELLAEEFAVGMALAQMEVAKLNSVPALNYRFMGEGFDGDLSEIVKDSRYYDVSKPYNAAVGTFLVWFNTSNLILGVDYYCKIVGFLTANLIPTYSIGTDPTPRPITEVIGAAR